ncbi:uncharacterized protein CheA7a [Hetaerina americana]|uniref:uncharacterized protein CheA7a n=1 Tax=Hetaerina americana TaxID=62018 RepID=UPI003A7F17C5
MMVKISFRESQDSWLKTHPLLIYIVACYACFIITAADRNYKIQLDKFVTISYDDTAVNFTNVKMVKYNRSTSALNGTFDFLKGPRPELLVSIEGYEKVGTQYMLSGIQVKEENLCVLLEKYGNLVFSPDDTITSNFKMKCPIKKGTYFIENYRPDENNMPEDVPGNDWRFDLKGRYPEQVDTYVFYFEAYIKIERDVTSWKPGMM